ncbi:unnamed protein product [Thelazia callipaeda]|uniref:Rpr2-domain-containing protein n=1 Tax=Thelazia callipaeda TaxID=103827 RepID=A0A0N5CMY5_THECL|nr:unnamed protein product [Thelazia callipaeda]
MEVNDIKSSSSPQEASDEAEQISTSLRRLFIKVVVMVVLAMDLRKKRRLHADQRAQITYQKILEERKLEREKRQLDKESRLKALEKYNSLKRKMNRALSKRNRRGQPNLNAQIEVLLEKIEKRVNKGMSDSRERKPNEIHFRCNFLYSAAGLISSISDNQAMQFVSQFYLREMKKLCDTELIRIEKDFNRTICKRCRCIFVPRSDGSQSMSLRLDRKKRLVRKCLNCHAEKYFVRNSKYLSRNERAQVANKEGDQQNETVNETREKIYGNQEH